MVLCNKQRGLPRRSMRASRADKCDNVSSGERVTYYTWRWRDGLPSPQVIISQRKCTQTHTHTHYPNHCVTETHTEKVQEKEEQYCISSMCRCVPAHEQDTQRLHFFFCLFVLFTFFLSNLRQFGYFELVIWDLSGVQTKQEADWMDAQVRSPTGIQDSRSPKTLNFPPRAAQPDFMAV